ncbi:SART-1 protein [Lasiosphaeria hispida]|uniref:SART-1 protein n=1 Tax=Lasiosphaeria hispida TaxID=260671 RepID=A0AAJ0H8Y3_9PEZI|nr:SART-1 protein [Lasiosphaeria hispida]
MDAASIEEINKLRRAMGMKPLPVPGAAAPSQASAGEDPDAPSTLETREALAYGNFKKVQEAEEAKKRREEKAAAVKKARDKAQRFAALEGKGIADLDEDDELDAKSWLKNQKKRQKKIDAQKKFEEEKAATQAIAEHTSADLADVKVAHDMASFLDADDQILTLKDTGVLENEEEGDELENLDMREQERLQEKIDLKKKKPVYDPNDVGEPGEHGILGQYDEEIHGKKKKVFTLGAVGTANDLADILDAPIQKRRHQVVELDVLEDAPAPVSDYLDPPEIKVKKPKKKKSKSTRQRRADDEDALYPGDEPNGGDDDQQMDVDSGPVTFAKKRKVFDEDFVDDDDLQTSLALQRKAALKKRKRTRPEDIARQLREEASQPPDDAEADKGLVIDEISEFVDALHAEREEERKAPKPKPGNAVTAMEEGASDEDEEMVDAHIKHEASPPADVPITGVEEEKTVAQGLGATLALLKDRHLIEDQNGAEQNAKFRQRQAFLTELNRRMSQFDEDTRLQRERDRASGRHEKMSIREREEYARQQNTMREQHQSRIMDQLFREGYKPNIELKYIDADGRSLDAKEAFKELSHQFHGKGSGKGKTDKRLKKLAEEKRRMSQSMLDASQNLGMSSAASHQGKKRKEAGVRLA